MILHFRELQSTNSYMRENLPDLPDFAVVVADNQTAGRGQRGNSWESEPGKNLLLSMHYCPPECLHPSRQFLISKAVSLATAEAVDRLLDGCGHPDVCVKWPNDIYVGDRKVAGILIENTLQSPAGIAHSVIGIGLNINQRDFRSNAPNPVSIISFTGRETPVSEAASLLSDTLISYLTRLGNGLRSQARDGIIPGLDGLYLSRLWRRTGFHPYVSLTASSLPAPTAVRKDSVQAGHSPVFEAEIVDVAPDGPLTLRLRSGESRVFHFKEVSPVL